MPNDQIESAVPIQIGEGVWRIRNRGHASNTYLCRLEDGESGFIIDPGIDEEAVLAGIHSLGFRLVGTFCTHGHFDHVGSAAAIRENFGAPIHLHEADLDLLKSANFHMMLAKVPGRISTPRVDAAASAGSRYLTGNDLIEFIHTPGHTLGSCCIRFGRYIFTGDTLYRDSLGLVNFPGEDPATLRESLGILWDTLPPWSVICPGHGGAGTLESIKENNVELRKFLFGDAQKKEI
ncbi:MAG: MBL fold metallo-hydrolase [Candidatus Nanopelagicales bacterium]|nr:MBL fold metallo-hydrolase [Candidatus Nanopelagicales bacterium]